jgi:hypothetical protein
MTRENLQPLLLDHKAVAKVHAASGKALKDCQPAVRDLARRQLLEALSGLLDIDPTALVLDAWRGSEDLAEAAERTRRDPGLRTVVDVAKQTFTAGREATLDISIDEWPVSQLPVRLDLELEVRALVAAVQDGRLTQISSGECKVTGTLFLDEVALPTYTGTIDLTLSVSVDPPVQLGRPTPLTAPASQPQPPPPPPPLHPDNRVVRLQTPPPLPLQNDRAVRLLSPPPPLASLRASQGSTPGRIPGR